MILCGSASTQAPIPVPLSTLTRGHALSPTNGAAPAKPSPTSAQQPPNPQSSARNPLTPAITQSPLPPTAARSPSEPAAKGAATCFPPRIPEHQRPCRQSFKSPARTANSRLSSSPTRLKCDDPGGTSPDERINHRHIRSQQQSYLQNAGTCGSIYE